jgi:diadenosine tetraphosphate (Ap4A) HIT family hydrolase
MFKLNAILAKDTFEIGELKLCKVLLMNDQHYPWLILVPQIMGLTEFHLVPEDRKGDLMSDITQASQVLQDMTSPKKLNVGALGNVVSQLHIHIIARFENDATWPGPVWGQMPAKPYPSDIAQSMISKLKDAFQSR